MAEKNRFTQMFSEPSPQTPPQAQGIPVGFALCPIFIIQVQGPQQFNSMQELYRQAYEQAQARARLTQLEKRFFSVWN
jgi:hypothetical protein